MNPKGQSSGRFLWKAWEGAMPRSLDAVCVFSHICSCVLHQVAAAKLDPL